MDVYFVVERDGASLTLQVAQLTPGERALVLARYDKAALLRLIDVLCENLQEARGSNTR